MPAGKSSKKGVKKTAPRKAPAKAALPDRVALGSLRTLGDVSPARKGPRKAPAPKALGDKARATLRSEFERVLAMQQKLRAEAAIGGAEKGRDADRKTEKLRSVVASLEGMNRFALAMGLITPAEAREMYAEAMKQGLYEGWS